MRNKSAIVTGITGQDGSLLCELLLKEGYTVHGLIRRNASNSLGNASHLEKDINFDFGDLQDFGSILKLQNLVRPNLFFNAAAQSDVKPSFDEPYHTSLVTGLGALNCLEAIRHSGIHTRFLQMGSSEMYGGVIGENFITEETPFHPRSPYSVAKVYAHNITVNYRESYNMFACNSICFNHEQPGRRGPNFVTRKICLGIKNIVEGKEKYLYLGNLDAKRDWGLASEYCRGIYDLISYKTPEDVIFATGETHSVREFCKIAFERAGLGDYNKYVKIDPKFYREAEVDILLGDSSKAQKLLGWECKVKFNELVEKMVDWEISNV
jgi:GDPmannose 4,6-dehydratase